jgi:ankyrin repeat protein
LAVVCEDSRLLSKLVEKGAKIDITDNKGNTPLHLAAKYDCKETVSVLVNYRAKKDIINNEGKTPLDMAKTEEIRRLLSQP